MSMGLTTAVSGVTVGMPHIQFFTLPAAFVDRVETSHRPRSSGGSSPPSRLYGGGRCQG